MATADNEVRSLAWGTARRQVRSPANLDKALLEAVEASGLGKQRRLDKGEVLY